MERETETEINERRERGKERDKHLNGEKVKQERKKKDIEKEIKLALKG